jgi:hypothetical protein
LRFCPETRRIQQIADKAPTATATATASAPAHDITDIDIDIDIGIIAGVSIAFVAGIGAPS